MKLKVPILVIIGLIVASFLYLYITRNDPVLYRSGDRDTAEQGGFVIQNPFRERGPEMLAETILQDVKGGNCQRALSLPAMAAEKIESTCERESAYPIQSWSLTDRRDLGDQTILTYKGYRNYGDKISAGLVWIDIQRIGENWRALSYQAYY
jgi:hypothetical protein